MFQVRLILCGCEDPNCTQREPELVGVLKEVGHPIKISQYYRVGGMCTGYFRNTDPDRMVLRHGMDANNANTIQDCIDKVIEIEDHPERCTLKCQNCIEMCKI
ncbi:hypothetical protein RJ55_07218 [Drechmeria coniospora]|nr:hypothetical protein RJ55_07218 [Drechmeria coniospora]